MLLSSRPSEGMDYRIYMYRQKILLGTGTWEGKRKKALIGVLFCSTLQEVEGHRSWQQGLK